MHRFLILVALLAACDRGAPGTGGRAPADDADPPTQGFAFERHLLFVGGAAAAPIAAVFDFTVVDRGSRLERTALSWVLRDGRWRPLLNNSWAQQPMREPWRLVPHGGLRLVATEEGELELVYREGGVTTRLRPGPGIAQWTGPRGREILLRQGSLGMGPDMVHGSILDLQLQRSSEAAADTGPSAYLTDGGSLHLVLFADALGGALWVRTADDDAVVDEFQLERSGTNGWRVTTVDGALRVDATAFGDGAVVGDGAEIRPLRGTLVLRGQRFNVYGLVRVLPS